MDTSRTRNEKVAVVVLDIDNFEALNHTAGHAAGDEALRMAARVLQGELRPGDVCGRIGGDEFLLALPDSDAWGAERVVERLRSAVAAAPMRNGRAGMTFSAGIAEFPRDARDQIGLMRAGGGRAVPGEVLGPQPLRRLLLVRRRPALAAGGGRARPHRRPGQHRVRAGPRGRPQGRLHPSALGPRRPVRRRAGARVRHVRGGDRPDPDGGHPARRRQGRRRRCRRC